MALVFIVEDDNDIRQIEAYALKCGGFEIEEFEDAKALYERLEKKTPDFFLLDVMLPDEDGLEIVKKLRAMPQTKHLPVMMVTAKTTELDKVRGLDIGADDYMTKPFEFSELMARLRVMLRTQNPVNENVITCGSLVVDMNNRQAIRDGKVIDLTVREYAILEYLARNRNVVVTREQIRVNIWNIDDEVNSNVIDVYIRYLRRKIDDNYEEKLIHTIRGVGYKLEC